MSSLPRLWSLGVFGVTLLALPAWAEPTPAVSVRPGPRSPGVPPPAPVSPRCPAAADPAGWFALGDPALPTSSAVAAKLVALALDARGEPWFALLDREP